MQKKAIEYRRFSADKQSNFSLERQEKINSYWATHNNILITDTFTDDGHSARTLDRPDLQRLFAFIKKNYRNIDYLLVAELTRFSRNLEDAIKTIREIQEYNIKIVSCSRGMIYDIKEHTSFIMMSLEFTFGHAENLKRQADITGGIRTAMHKGEYINPRTPYGYSKVGERKKKLVIDNDTAPIVQFIFTSYAKGLPFTFIQQEAKKMGYNRKGKSVIAEMLANPVYIGKQYVEAWKDETAGLKTGNWDPLIDLVTWQQVQERLQDKKPKGISINDNFPLRGVLRCSCGKHVTGAPSKSRNGTYYDYYKCNYCKGLNVSAPFAHQQLTEIMHLLSPAADLIGNIFEQTQLLLQNATSANKKQLMQQRTALSTTTSKLHNLEEKFIATTVVSPETYSRLHQQYTDEIQQLQTSIEDISRQENEFALLTADNLQSLTDMQALYTAAPVPLKHELLNTVFDRQLYYKDKVYRTGYIMELFTGNELILREKKLLYVERKRAFGEKARYGGQHSTFIEPLVRLLSLLQAV